MNNFKSQFSCPWCNASLKNADLLVCPVCSGSLQIKPETGVKNEVPPSPRQPDVQLESMDTTVMGVLLFIFIAFSLVFVFFGIPYFIIERVQIVPLAVLLLGMYMSGYAIFNSFNERDKFSNLTRFGIAAEGIKWQPLKKILPDKSVKISNKHSYQYYFITEYDEMVLGFAEDDGARKIWKKKDRFPVIYNKFMPEDNRIWEG